MTTQYNVAEAKAQLSRILDQVLAGEDVVLARSGVPLARLVPVEVPTRRELGFLPLAMPDGRFDPLTEAELADWE
ncbi:type II toxin-antitoxin system Phd/YefM family antitoxin [Aquipuribacter sp. SD81]|uniref:type II toxin-antitoxin system Phd/YefM family antitoxin n=1 Tax=Aquipuribacter sp. SD81 TaxID=3127703 RepID=UPI00301A3F19